MIFRSAKVWEQVSPSLFIGSPQLRFRVLLATSGFAAMMGTTAVHAQGPAPADSAAAEEIIVTARRTEEKLETVPTAVTAFTPQQLREQGIHTEADLQLTVPGFTVRETENQNTLTFSIRGQTVDAYTGSATAVVPYINEVQLYTGGAGAFFDLDSIQVLKGPQGTLFGRNTTGGAVLYTTVKPGPDFGGYLQAGYGNYNAYEEQGAITVQIFAETLLGRIAFVATNRDCYIHNLYYDQWLGAVDRQNIRFSLTWQPTDDIKNSIVFEYIHSLGNNTGEIASYVSPTGTAATLYSPILDKAFGIPGAWAAYLKANPLVPATGALGYVAVQKALGPYSVKDIEGSLHREHGYYVTNSTTYDVTPNLRLKNIFGFSYDNSRDLSSENGTPYGIQYTENLATGEIGNRQNIDGVSEEVQAQGDLFDDQLKYTVGAFYQNTDTQILYPQSYFNLGPLGVLSSVDSHFETKDSTEALYAQGTYDLSQATGIDGLSFTAGYRYSWETFKLAQLPGSDSYPAAPQTIYFSNPSWLASVSYQIDPDLMVYVQGRRSWRSGGLNGVAPPINAEAAGGGDEYAPEYTRDVELGLKYGGRILGRAAHVNVAVYDQWIDNVQRAEFPSLNGHSIAVTINVPSAEVTGAEFDAAIKATDWLDLGAAGAYNYARYTDNTSLIFGTKYIFGPYGDTPRASGSLYGRVMLPAPEEWGAMSLRADLYAQTGQWYSNNGSTILPNTKLPGYGLVNLRYDWTDMFGSSLSLGAFVKNLGDRVYYVGGLAQGVSLGSDAVTVGTPRMYGFELRYRFGGSS